MARSLALHAANNSHPVLTHGYGPGRGHSHAHEHARAHAAAGNRAYGHSPTGAATGASVGAAGSGAQQAAVPEHYKPNTWQEGADVEGIFFANKVAGTATTLSSALVGGKSGHALGGSILFHVHVLAALRLPYVPGVSVTAQHLLTGAYRLFLSPSAGPLPGA